MKLTIPDGATPYIYYVMKYKEIINKCVLQWQISTIEGVIINMIYKYILNQIEDRFIAWSHCNDLLNECLIRRCVLISQQYNDNVN